MQAHFIFAASIMLCSPHTSYHPTVWKSPPDYCNKDREGQSTHSGSSSGILKQEKKYWLALNQHAHIQTDVHTAEVHCQELAWLSLQHSSLHSDRVVAACCQDVSVVFGGQSKQRSLAASPISHTRRVHTHT